MMMRFLLPAALLLLTPPLVTGQANTSSTTAPAPTTTTPINKVHATCSLMPAMWSIIVHGKLTVKCMFNGTLAADTRMLVIETYTNKTLPPRAMAFCGKHNITTCDLAEGVTITKKLYWKDKMSAAEFSIVKPAVADYMTVHSYACLVQTPGLLNGTTMPCMLSGTTSTHHQSAAAVMASLVLGWLYRR